MAIKYLQSEQIVPGQGMSYTLYEIEGENIIKRMLTTIPNVNKIKIYPKPPVKTLFAPERCQAVLENHFKSLWKEGGGSED